MKEEFKEEFCAFGLIGDCTTKQKTTINSVVSTINENLVSVLSQTLNTNSQSCTSNQQLTVKAKNIIIRDDCSVDFSQKATLVCNVDTAFENTTTSDFVSKMETAIDQSATSAQSNVADFLSTQVYDGDTQINMSQYIKNVVRRDFAQETRNVCLSEAKINQEGELLIDGDIICSGSGSLNFSQDAQAKVIASCLTKSIVNTLTNDTVVNDVVSKIDSTQSSEQKGLGDIIRSFFELLGSFKWVLVGCVVCIALIFIVFLLSGGTKIIGDVAKERSSRN